MMSLSSLLVAAFAVTVVYAAPAPPLRRSAPPSPPPQRAAPRSPPLRRAVAPGGLPDYALQYAPISYLHSKEPAWPSDVVIHLQHIIPEIKNVPVPGSTTAGSVTLDILNNFNDSVYLTSADVYDGSAEWQKSEYGKPDKTGYSAAPGTIVAVQKNATCVDVFYFTFFSYNIGGTYALLHLDYHVGDWEHTMIRFVDGKPSVMYFSQHSSGSAYTWEVLNKDSSGQRPFAYIGKGGHANYAKVGSEQYTPFFFITDKTDTGYAWDMTKNYRGYWYDSTAGTFASAGGAGVGAVPVNSTTGSASWLQWLGHWGNSKKTKVNIHGIFSYSDGPTGPAAKNLTREVVCQREKDCTVFDKIDKITHQI